MELFEAIEAADADRVRALIDSDPSAAAARNEAGLSAVLAAQYRHQHQIVEMLLGAAPTLDIFDAAAVGDCRRLAELLDEDPSLVNAYAPDGFYPLGLASYFRQPEAVRLLLERGAEVHAVARNPMKVQSLHAAVAGRNTEAVRLLLDAGAAPDAQQHGGWTPLMAAAAHGDTENVDLLLRAGAEPSPDAVAQARDNGHDALADRLESLSR